MRETVIIATLVSVGRRETADPQLLDSGESQRAPRGARNVVAHGDVQSNFAEAARSAPYRTFIEESRQDTGSPLAWSDVRR
jgi:hypothetical protein